MTINNISKSSQSRCCRTCIPYCPQLSDYRHCKVSDWCITGRSPELPDQNNTFSLRCTCDQFVLEATAFRRLEEQVLQIGGYVETKVPNTRDALVPAAFGRSCSVRGVRSPFVGKSSRIGGFRCLYMSFN